MKNTSVTEDRNSFSSTPRKDAGGPARVAQFVVFLYAQMFKHTDAALERASLIAEAGQGGQGEIGASSLGKRRDASPSKAHEAGEALALRGASAREEAEKTPVKGNGKKKSDMMSMSPASARAVAIESRAADDAEHLLFVEEYLELILNTLQECFPTQLAGDGNGPNRDALSDAAMCGMELLLSGPHAYEIRAMGASSPQNADNDMELGQSSGGELLKWLKEHLVVSEPPSSALHHTPTLDIHAVQRATLFQTPQYMQKVADGEVTDLQAGVLSQEQERLIDVHVANCHSSFIYLLSPFRFAVVQSCQNCTIVIGACRGVVSIERCEGCHIIVCGWQLRVANCVDIKISTSTLRSPLLLGDNRSLLFAPYPTQYPGLEDHLKKTGMLPRRSGADCWDRPVDLANLSQNSFKLLDPVDFMPFTIPCALAGGDGTANADYGLQPPKIYSDALQQKIDAVQQLRSLVRKKNSEVSDGKGTSTLQAAVQKKFREWLRTSGNIRQVADLIALGQSQAVFAPGKAAKQPDLERVKGSASPRYSPKAQISF